MGEDIKWLIGLAAGLGGTFTVALIATFRSLSASMQNGEDRLAASLKEGDDQLHERVNRVKDEYVRRVDLDDHVRQLRDGMKEMRDETREGLKETNKRLDQVLAVLAQDKK
jgi:CHASE3 domain sensor protein